MCQTDLLLSKPSRKPSPLVTNSQEQEGNVFFVLVSFAQCPYAAIPGGFISGKALPQAVHSGLENLLLITMFCK